MIEHRHVIFVLAVVNVAKRDVTAVRSLALCTCLQSYILKKYNACYIFELQLFGFHPPTVKNQPLPVTRTHTKVSPDALARTRRHQLYTFCSCEFERFLISLNRRLFCWQCSTVYRHFRVSVQRQCEAFLAWCFSAARPMLCICMAATRMCEAAEYSHKSITATQSWVLSPISISTVLYCYPQVISL